MSAPNSPRKAATTRTSSQPQNPKKLAMNQPVTPQVADRLTRIHSDMVAMTNIVKLAQFAAEARRVLQGVEDLGRQNPEVASAIGESVEAPREWQVCEDVLGQVLGYAVNRLERDRDELELHIGEMHRSANTSSTQAGGAS
jgi:hypothetical protein